MGIRITLGASRSRAVWTAALPGIVLTAARLAFGLALSALSTRFLASRIFGVEALDPLTFLLAALFLMGVAVLASVLPALRLLRLNPAQTLRAD
jgi:ABC-type antimicrobial peptide transport system permease subunit